MFNGSTPHLDFSHGFVFTQAKLGYKKTSQTHS